MKAYLKILRQICMTIYNTPSLPPCRVTLLKFYIHVEFLDTKLLVFTVSEGFPSKHECKNIFMVILLILIQEQLSTLHAERTMHCKIVYFTRQRFAGAIIDAETLRSLFVNFSRIFGISRHTSCMLFHKCTLISGTCPPRPLRLYDRSY